MGNRILEYWYGTNLYRWVIKWSQKTTLPGFARLSLYTVVGFIWKEIKRDDITTRANSVAFSFMLSLFPTIIFLFTLVPLLPISNLDNIINGYLNDFLPNNATNFLNEIITDLTKKKRGGLLSVGFIMAVYFASNGMMALMRGFEKTYDDTFKKRSGVEKRVIAIRMTFLLAILVIGSALFIILSNLIFGTLFKWLALNTFSRVFFNVLKWVVVVSLFYAVITTIYRYAIPTKRRLPYVTPGAALATFFSICSSIGFSYFVNNFGTYNKVYGSIGALIVVMIWIQINSFILLLGFELNASIAVNREIRRQKILEEKQKP